MAHLQFQMFSPLSSWWEAWQHALRHDAKEVAGSPISRRQQEIDWHTGQYSDHRKPQGLLPRRHTSSNKIILTPTKPHLLIVPLPMRLQGLMTFKWPHSPNSLLWLYLWSMVSIILEPQPGGFPSVVVILFYHLLVYIIWNMKPIILILLTLLTILKTASLWG